MYKTEQVDWPDKDKLLMGYYFTADTHFNHDAIMRHCKRPFKEVGLMDDYLIDAWNRTVDPAGVIVIAGDFAWDHNHDYVVKYYVSKLNGNKIWLKGNHDRWMGGRNTSFHWEYLYHKMMGGKPKTTIAVSHYPMRSWKNSGHGSINLHGHCHGTMTPLKRQLDIGVDNAKKLLGDYVPFSWEQIQEIVQ
jgi:calcineurin-like phosphoesterase family protein